MVPSVGCARGLARQFWHDGTRWAAGTFDAIPVRATSAAAPPAKGTFQLLSLDGYLMAFDYAWTQAIAEGMTSAVSEFRQAAKSIRVKFVLLPREIDCELQKWVPWQGKT